jgi:hypothetical protein
MFHLSDDLGGRLLAGKSNGGIDRWEPVKDEVGQESDDQENENQVEQPARYVSAHSIPLNP